MSDREREERSQLAEPEPSSFLPLCATPGASVVVTDQHVVQQISASSIYWRRQYVAASSEEAYGVADMWVSKGGAYEHWTAERIKREWIL